MITSTSNSQMKTIVQLNKKAKARRELCVFVVEGIKLFSETKDEMIEKVYVSESLWESANEQLSERIQKLPYEIVTDAVLKSVSDTTTPQGITCLVRMPHYELSDLLKEEAPRLLVLEDIQDPGNLGTMFRTGEGAGIHGIIMSKNTVDLFHPKTVRSTMGSIYRVPFYVAEDLGETIVQLKNHGIETYAAHLKGEANYDAFDYCKAHAFLIGNEGNGLSDEIADLADHYLKIPMGGQLESLNAAMAAGILMYEANRQRRN